MCGVYLNYSYISKQVLLLHKASKGSFSRVFDFEANDLKGEDNDERIRYYTTNLIFKFSIYLKKNKKYN